MQHNSYTHKYIITPIIYTLRLSLPFSYTDSRKGMNKYANKGTEDVPNRELSVSVVNALCVASLRLMSFKRGCRCHSEPSTGTFTYLTR